MKQRTKFILAILLFLACSAAYAQENSIRGKVANAEDSTILVGSTVQMINIKDTTKLHYAVADLDGHFLIENLDKAFYKLKITSLGFITFSNFVKVNEEEVNVGTLLLTKDTKLLKDVEISAQVIPVKQRGDTTEYNAIAYKTNPDANAQDLMEKMPGFIVENGTIQAQGENVQRVLVDGKEFFGDDPRAALTNIPADIIDKIEVYDQQSDQAQFSGFDDGETTKTVNIVTKSDMRNGQFGNVYAGYGLDQDRYHAGANVNFFNGDKRLSIIGQSNNINIQNFGTEDLLGVVGGGSRRGRGGRGGGGGGGRRGGGGSGGGGRSIGGGRGGGVSDFLVNSTGGISQTNALGVNFSDEWGENLQISGSYFFNRSDNDSDQYLNQEYFSPSQVYREDNISYSTNTNHRLNMRLEYKIDDKNSISMRPRLTIQQNDGFENIFANTSSEDLLINNSENKYGSDLYGVDFSNNLLFRHRFDKAGRTISLNVSTSYSQDSGDGRLRSNIENYLNQPITFEELNQNSDLLTEGYTLSSNVSYTEPIGERSQMEFSFRNSINKNNSDQETFDYSESADDYNLLNALQSSVFDSKTVTNAIGTSYRYNKDKISFMTRLLLQDRELQNEQSLPLTYDITRSYLNVTPVAMFQYRPSRQRSLRIFYTSNTSTPSVSQLQDVVDRSNPLQLSTGNPNLDQNFNHSVFVRYNSTNVDKSTVFFAMVRASFVQDYVGSSISIAGNRPAVIDGIGLDPGTQLTRPVNLDGYASIRSFVTYGVPLKWMKSNLNGNASIGFTRTPGMINEQINNADNGTYTLGATLSSNISEKVDFTFAYRSSYNTVNNSLQIRGVQDDNFFSQTVRGKLYIMFPKSLVFRTDLANTSFSGLSDSFNQNYWIWNMSLGKKIFKSQRGEITVGMADVLGQNQSIRRNVTANYIEDVQSLVLQRYYMLTFTYKIRNFIKGVQNQGDNGDDERRKRFREQSGFESGGRGSGGGGGRRF